MPHTAPAPNIVPIPGMDPGEAVAAGGGGSGGDDGNAGDGGDKEGAGGGKGGDDASSDNRNAPDPKKYPTCGTESHPVDVVTGRVFTHPITDLELPGPLPFRFERSYSSTACREDQGLGFGWAHSFGWSVQVFRDRVRVWNELGVSVSFPIPQIGHTIHGDWGWVIRREANGFAVDANDDVWRFFELTFDECTTYRLTAIQERNKNRIALSYDAAGKLVAIKDSAGRTIKVTSTKEGRIASIEVKNAEHQGRWIAFARYQYDEQGRLVKVTDADDYSWTYEYDQFNRLVRDTDRAGLSFCFRYDEKDRGIEAWGEYAGKKDPSLADDLPKYLADGTTRAKGIYHRKFEYHPRGYTEVTDTTETRRYFGNRKGMLDKAVTGGGVTTSKYDERGFEIEKTDPMNATWSWVRDERGRLLKTVDPLGRTTRFERDAYGLPVVVTDPAGGVTRGHRDQAGNLQTLQDPTGGATQYVYDERGLMTSVTNAVGATTRYAYDAHGNLVGLLQPNGGRWQIAYDGFGRKVVLRNPMGAETRYAYSDRGDLVAVYDATGGVTRYSYDAERRPTQLVSPSGHTTQVTWGGFNKLCARRDANGCLVRLAYSREGELLHVFNEREETHSFEYDSAGRLVREHTFDGRTLEYRRDPVGRIVRFSNGAGEVSKFTYDAAGQLVGRELPDDTEERFEYSLLGHLVRAANAAADVVLVRDAVGRVVRETQVAEDEQHSIDVTYDGAGHRIARRTSKGHVETMQRDAMGARLTTLLDENHRVDHVTDLLAREVQRRLPAGGVIESAFDAMGRLAQRRVRAPTARIAVGEQEPEWLGHRDDGVTAMTVHSYDADGSLTSKSDRHQGVTRFDYDPVGRLLASLPAEARAEVFRYDPTGNIFPVDPGSRERVYGPGNRLLRDGDIEHHWDAAGRLVRESQSSPSGNRIWNYGWNAAGLLESVERPDGRRVEFAYDAFARRVRTQVREKDGLAWRIVERARFVWDGDVLAHEIRVDAKAAGDPIVTERTYCFDDDTFAPTAHRDGAGPWFSYVNDYAGTPERLVDERGEVACTLVGAVWRGGAPSSGDRTTTPLRFAGQYEDRELEGRLAYSRFRFYSASTGRFISPDPLGLDGSTNTYAYAPNPFSWIDPFGLSFAGSWSRAQVRDALANSEGVNPTGNPNQPVGHAQASHGSITDAALQARANADQADRSAFRTCAQQARATADALNSPQGQAALAQLDAGAPSANFVAPVSSVARVASPGGAGPTEQNASNVFVRVFNNNGQLHVQTSYPTT